MMQKGWEKCNCQVCIGAHTPNTRLCLVSTYILSFRIYDKRKANYSVRLLVHSIWRTNLTRSFVRSKGHYYYYNYVLTKKLKSFFNESGPRKQKQRLEQEQRRKTLSYCLSPPSRENMVLKGSLWLYAYGSLSSWPPPPLKLQAPGVVCAAIKGIPMTSSSRSSQARSQRKKKNECKKKNDIYSISSDTHTAAEKSGNNIFMAEWSSPCFLTKKRRY